ncbi:MAG: DUF1223 domain-containing protein [Bacteroidota bacterium]
MKSSLLTLFIIPTLFFSPVKKNSIENENKIILELFTSQGCSSCPPADRILDEVKSKDIIALSYHVDYWNYIGWTDPFSKADFTKKQEDYAAKFNSSSLYTPQLVINGQEHFVGSNKNLVKQKIKEYSNKGNLNTIDLSEVIMSDEKVKFNYDIKGDLDEKFVRTILVINERKTKVKRGENSNKELINTNIVVKEQRFKLIELKGEGRLIIPEIVESDDQLSLIVVVENSGLDITGASQKSL